MLIFNKEHKDKQRDTTGLLPPYTSCPNLKMENVQGHNMTSLSPGGEFYDRNTTLAQHQYPPAMQQFSFEGNMSGGMDM